MKTDQENFLGRRALWRGRGIVGRAWVVLLFFGLALVLTLVFGQRLYWRQALSMLADGLEARGVAVSVGSVTPLAFGEIELRDVELFRTVERKHRSARLDRVVLAPAYDSFGGKRRWRGSVVFSGSKIELREGDETLVVDDLGGVIETDAGGARGTALDAVVGGIRVRLQGTADWGGSPQREAEAVGVEAETGVIEMPAIDLSPLFEVMEWIDFDTAGEPPLLGVFFERDASTGGLKIQGSLRGGGFRWRGLPVHDAVALFSGEFGAGSSVLTLHHLALATAHGSVRGEAALDFAGGKIQTGGLEFQGLAPALLLGASGLDAAWWPEGLSPDETLTGRVDGVFAWSDWRRSSLKVVPDPATSVRWKAPGMDVTATQLTGSAHLLEGQLKLENVAWEMLSGAAGLEAEVSLADPTLPFRGRVELRDINLARLEAATGGRIAQSGLMQMEFEGSGTKLLADLQGEGKLTTSGQELAHVPVFSELMQLLSILFVDFGGGSRSGLEAPFAIRDGVLASDAIALNAPPAVIHARGESDLAAREFEVHAGIRTGGVSALVTALVGQALSVRAAGTYDSWKWYFQNIPGLRTLDDLGALERAVQSQASPDSMENGAPADDVEPSPGGETPESHKAHEEKRGGVRHGAPFR